MGRFTGKGPFLCAALFAAAVGQAEAADLRISVGGVRNADGLLLIAVYDDPARFRQPGAAAATIRLKARAGDSSVTLNGLAPGGYAVVAFHDENANGELDANLLGIPTEGYGFSNDARSSFGPPSYDAARVDVGADGSRTASIDLRY